MPEIKKLPDGTFSVTFTQDDCTCRGTEQHHCHCPICNYCLLYTPGVENNNANGLVIECPRCGVTVDVFDNLSKDAKVSV